MCTAYWTVIIKRKCPVCKKKKMMEFQTHDFGNTGSCLHAYKLNEPVIELAGHKRTSKVSFIDVCSGKAILATGTIKGNRVIKINKIKEDK